jgi:hypothetical protein
LFWHRAHFFLYIPTLSGISVHFYVAIVSLHFKCFTWFMVQIVLH